jgi:hypothetical protein
MRKLVRSFVYFFNSRRTNSLDLTDDPEFNTIANPPRQELDDGLSSAEKAQEENGYDLGIEDDGHWYMGRARDEFNRRRREADAIDGDDDPIQVCV